MPVENWFSIPTYYTDIVGDDFDAIQNEIGNSITNLRDDLSNPWEDNVKTTFKHSGNDYLQDYNLINFQKTMLTHVDQFRLSVGYAANQAVRYDIKGWINFSYNGNFQFDHDHGIGGISGVYYYKTNGEDGDIVFEHPTGALLGNYFPFTENYKQVIYKPIVGRLVLFPSWLPHRVKINTTQNLRISVAFNCDMIFENNT